MLITIEGPLLNQSTQCAPILHALPDWFGIQEATQNYINDIAVLPTFLASTSKQTVGFVSLTRFQEISAEIHVMGILPDYHHQGIGRQLVLEAENYLRQQGVRFLQVKTLSERHPDPFYAVTRTFYRSLGFVPLQEFPDLWGAENPCLQMIKHI